MVAALFTNPNWDDEKADRTGRIKELNNHFNRAIELIYDPSLKDEQEIDWDNPFWQGHLRSIQRTREKWGLEAPRDTIGDIIAADDQHKAELRHLTERARMRRNVDQLAT